MNVNATAAKNAKNTARKMEEEGKGGRGKEEGLFIAQDKGKANVCTYQHSHAKRLKPPTKDQPRFASSCFPRDQ